MSRWIPRCLVEYMCILIWLLVGNIGSDVLCIAHDEFYSECSHYPLCWINYILNAIFPLFWFSCYGPPALLQTFRVRTMQSLGVNAWRMSHNPPNPELLDALDKVCLRVYQYIYAIHQYYQRIHISWYQHIHISWYKYIHISINTGYPVVIWNDYIILTDRICVSLGLYLFSALCAS